MTTTRWRTRLLSSTLVLVALVLSGSPAQAHGHDPRACRPDDGRIAVPSDFFLDACFDGTWLVIVNRTNLPVTLTTTGDVHVGTKTPASPGVTLASTLADRWDPRLLVPGYQMALPINSAGGQVRLTLNDSIGQQYALTQRITALAPSIAGFPDLYAKLLGEVSGAYTDLLRCRKSHQNFLQQSWCGQVPGSGVTADLSSWMG